MPDNAEALLNAVRAVPGAIRWRITPLHYSGEITTIAELNAAVARFSQPKPVPPSLHSHGRTVTYHEPVPVRTAAPVPTRAPMPAFGNPRTDPNVIHGTVPPSGVTMDNYTEWKRAGSPGGTTVIGPTRPIAAVEDRAAKQVVPDVVAEAEGPPQLPYSMANDGAAPADVPVVNTPGFSVVDDVLLPADIAVNEITGGAPGETVSARVGRRESPVSQIIAGALDTIDPGHTQRALANVPTNYLPRVPATLAARIAREIRRGRMRCPHYERSRR